MPFAKLLPESLLITLRWMSLSKVRISNSSGNRYVYAKSKRLAALTNEYTKKMRKYARNVTSNGR